MRNGILQGRLSDERIQMLDAIGFLWNKNRKREAGMNHSTWSRNITSITEDGRLMLQTQKKRG